MRPHAFALALALASAATASAAQRSGVSEYHPAPASGPAKSDEEIRADVRRAAGLRDVKEFQTAAQAANRPKAFPWLATGLALGALLIASPFAYRMFRATRTDLEDQSTFGLGASKRAAREEAEEPVAEPPRRSRRPPARAAGETRIVKAPTAPPAAPAAEEKAAASPALSPRDRVWDVVIAARTWVSVDFVAAEAGLSAEVVADEIGALAQEGYLQQTRDRAGKPVFRTPAG